LYSIELILGDAYISRKNSENAYLRFEQSIIHREYLLHIFDKFKYLSLIFFRRPANRKGARKKIRELLRAPAELRRRGTNNVSVKVADKKI